MTKKNPRKGSTVTFKLNDETLEGTILQMAMNKKVVAIEYRKLTNNRVMIPIEDIVSVKKY